MAAILSGAEAALEIDAQTSEISSELEELGISPTLAVIRVGENAADLSYERNIIRRAEKTGINVEIHTFSASCTEQELVILIHRLNKDAGIDGIILFRPLPKELNEERIINLISPDKDVDGVTDASMAGVYSGKKVGYPPCTADAVMRILLHYEIPLKGTDAVIIGRSLVVGKPLAMMLLSKNATVTICHTKTKDLPSVAKKAELLISCAGHIGTVTKEHVGENAILIDVGINDNKDGGITGDIDAEAQGVCKAYTPVPGGVGAVTVSVLLKHVADSAKRSSGQ